MHQHKPASTFETRRVLCGKPLRRLILAGVGACFLLLTYAPFSEARGQLHATPSPASGALVVRGTLGMVAGKGPSLSTAQRDYVLRGQSPYLLHVLEDKRLLGQELQLEGTRSGGAFVVSRVLAVRDGKLYKIQYYCEVCHITYVEPGHCYCCGRETKLKEVPLSEGKE